MNEPRVLVDGRPLTHPTAGGRGIGNYTQGLLSGLVAAGADVVALVAPGDEHAASQLTSVPIHPWRHELPVEGSPCWYLATGMFLHPTHFDPIPRAVTDASLPVAAVIYDVIPYQDPAHYQHTERARRLAAIRAPLVRTADTFLAISAHAQTTAIEALDLDPEACVTIGAGVRELFCPDPTNGSSPSTTSFSPPATVVSLVGADRRKNAEGLLRAWASIDLPDDARLVLLGDGLSERIEQWQSLATELGCARSVQFVPSPDDDTLLAWFRWADLVVQPSLSEGFGLPIVEAAACGTPVIASSTGAGTEVLGGVATFDPYLVDDIAASIQRGLWDPMFRQELTRVAASVARRWTWPATGERALRGLERQAGRLARSAPTTRSSLALVGSVRQAAEMARIADLAEPNSHVTWVSSTDDRDRDRTWWPRGAWGPWLKPHDFDTLIVFDDEAPAQLAGDVAIVTASDAAASVVTGVHDVV